MRRWGVVVTAFYLAVVLFLLHPLFMGLFGKEDPLTGITGLMPVFVTIPLWWILMAILVGGQALLLFLSVDSSWRRLRPRQHVTVTSGLAGALTALLAFAVIWAIAVGIGGENALDWPYSPFHGKDRAVEIKIAAWWAGLWVFWSAVFYLHYRGTSDIVSSAVAWLLKGSILELLIAIPAHIIVRQRNDCSAPGVTSWGIVTGIAIMLLCFGPSVLALYKKRLDAYSRKNSRA